MEQFDTRSKCITYDFTDDTSNSSFNNSNSKLVLKADCLKITCFDAVV
jgi:hypothetical protein